MLGPQQNDWRILCNDDGWIMNQALAPLSVADLKERMIDTYAGVQHRVALMWCIGDHEVYEYETQVGELFGQGYKLETASDKRTFTNISHLMKEAGGPLTALTELCHQAGMGIFPSVRMNSHYQTDPSSPGYGQFRREHTEYLIGKPGTDYPEGGVEWSIRTGLNYAVPEVRAHMAAIIIELFERFDTDGVELDFMRHPAFFRPEEAYANRYLMTDLLRHVSHRMREVSESSGRSLELVARVPPILAESARIGLDVAEWIGEGLVDIVVMGGGFIPFESAIEEFVAATQDTDCSIYGCIESLRPAVDDEIIRAIASRYWRAGASGIHLFNYYGKSAEWKQRVFNQIGDPKALARLDKRYLLDDTDRLAPVDQHDYPFRYAVPPVQLPVALHGTLSMRGPVLRIEVADDVESAAAEGVLAGCTLRLGLENYEPEDELEVRLNGETLSSGTSKASFSGLTRLEWTGFPTRMAEVSYTGGTLEFDIACPPLRQGDNELDVRLVQRTVQQSTPLVLRDVEVAVRYG